MDPATDRSQTPIIIGQAKVKSRKKELEEGSILLLVLEGDRLSMKS